MEIITAPYQHPPSVWSRLVVVIGVFAPVTLLSLLPIGLGLDRYVVTTDEMAPSISRGALVLERDVPFADLEVGDVITYEPPAPSGADGPVTRRIVAIEGTHVLTRADARPEVDPWPVPVSGATQQRVVLAVPLVGYLYVGLLHPELGPAVVLALLVLGLVAGAWWLRGQRGRRRWHEPPWATAE